MNETKRFAVSLLYISYNKEAFNSKTGNHYVLNQWSNCVYHKYFGIPSFVSVNKADLSVVYITTEETYILFPDTP